MFNQNVGGANGYTYGTSLFVSEPAPALASKPYGYGAYGSAGLFSNHDQTAKCVLNSMCTAAQCSTGECNAGNMCCPTSIYGATDIDMSKKAGYPAQLVGNSLGGTIGGVPQAKAPAFGTSASIDPTKVRLKQCSERGHASNSRLLFLVQQLQAGVDAQVAGVDDQLGRNA